MPFVLHTHLIWLQKQDRCKRNFYDLMFANMIQDPSKVLKQKLFSASHPTSLDLGT